MPCDTRLKPGVTVVQRNAEIGQAIARLEKLLGENKVRVVVDKRTGAVAFEGWSPELRDDVTDLCAYRRMAARSSWALRQAVARAEVLAGRKVDERALAAGVHSHDGGKTWGAH
jgi:hypothetical protein